MEYDPGCFIAAKLDLISGVIVNGYAQMLDLDPIPVDKLHVTIMYSKVSGTFPYPLIPDNFYLPVDSLKLVYIGKAIAISLYSPWLKWRRNLAVACGMRNNFGNYIPHLSIAYNPPMGLILPNLPTPPNNLALASEYMQPLNTD